MQSQQRVRTPTDVGERADREWLFVRPSETADVSIEETDDGQTEITVPISSTTAHRSGSRMSESALESMAAQLADGTVGLWDDHGLDEMGWPEYRRQDMYGWWVGGENEDGILMGTARLRAGDERSADLVDQLEQGMPIGFSVGYIPLDEEWVETDEGDFEGTEQRVIHDVDLLETSPVGIPDNPNAYADAPARLIAHAIADAGVDVDRQTASIVADGVADALRNMADEPDNPETNGADDGGDAEGTETETNDGDSTETRQFSEEEIEEIMAALAPALESALEEALSELAEGGDGDDDDDEGDEESAEGDDDDDDEEEESAALTERLDALEAELEEKSAKIDRLESESRESAGRKGMSTPSNTGDGEDDDESNSTTEHAPRDAFEAFAED